MADAPDSPPSSAAPLPGAGPDPMEEPQELDALLDPARRAVESGDYGRALADLKALAEAHGAASAFGGRLRLLMATALMGQGRSAEAAGVCRSLRACRDATLRAQARELEEVLDAPALERPREWSMTLPSLAEIESLEGNSRPLVRRRRPKPPAPPAPPTGPTSPPWGLALLVGLVLVLTLVLGGCVQLETSLRFPAPGRLQFSQSSLSATGRRLPWQQQLAVALESTPLRQRQDHGLQTLRSPVLPAPEALELLGRSVATAAQLGGLELPPPQLQLEERNWLLGVRQHFSVGLDLRAVPALPGLDLHLNLEPVGPRALRLAEPLPARALPGRTLAWTLQPGALNRLELRCWRWSRLGLGSLAIGTLLALTLLLQRLRLRAGFGLPELPA